MTGERDPRVRLTDEHGLIGKIAIVWLLLLGILAIGAWDAGSIAITSFRLSNTADRASLDAATAYRDSSNRNDAYAAALARVRREAPDAKITRLTIDPATKQVTVTLRQRTATLLAGRIGFLKRYARVTASSTSGPPAL